MSPICHHNARSGVQAQRILRSCRPCFTASRIAPRLPRLLLLAQAAKSTPVSKPLYQPTSARDAIETATRAFKEQQDADEAIRLYRLSLQLKPNDDEARAALYNMGCALAKQKKWAEASDCIVSAINDYKLKLSVALKDDDLAQLRERREWLDAVATRIRGGISRDVKADLRTEAKAPFRLPRIILFGGLLLSAGVGLIIILGRLARAVQGGSDAPDLQESLTNAGINSAAVLALSALLARDLRAKREAVRISTREELLGRLQVDLGGGRVLPLLKFRGQVRPVIVAGSRAFVERALREAEGQQLNLRDRAVSVIPVIFESASPPSELDPEEKLRALKRELQKEGQGFGESSRQAASAAAAGGEAASSRSKPGKAPGGLVESDKKWRLEPHDVEEWKSWLLEQRELAGLSASRPDCYVQVQLDGSVRSSGVGAPPWRRLVEELPLRGSLQTSLMDGVGPQE